MNDGPRSAFWCATVLVVSPIAITTNAAVPRDITGLQQQVAEWRSHATIEQLDNAAALEYGLVECSAAALANARQLEYGSILFVGDDEYHFTTVDMDETHFCLFMSRPLHRPLSLAEAIDLQDARIMVSTMPIKPKTYTADEVKVAEAGLAELLEAVRTKHFPPMDKEHPTLSLDQGKMVDCSRIDPRELALNASNVTSGFMYNGFYQWGTVPMGTERYCVYLEAPFDRGLSAADSLTFLTAPMLRMGVSQSYRTAHHIPSEDGPP